MKTIIAGSRWIRGLNVVETAVKESGFEITEVVSGGAKGPDTFGVMWARQQEIPFKIFPADWNRFGKGAGPMRNLQMADYADALIAIWDGESAGTENMIEVMQSMGKPVYVLIVPRWVGGP